MADTVKVNVKLNKKGKISRSGGKWVVRRNGTINGASAVQTKICGSLLEAIKEKFARG